MISKLNSKDLVSLLQTFRNVSRNKFISSSQESENNLRHFYKQTFFASNKFFNKKQISNLINYIVDNFLQDNRLTKAFFLDEILEDRSKYEQKLIHRYYENRVILSFEKTSFDFNNPSKSLVAFGFLEPRYINGIEALELCKLAKFADYEKKYYGVALAIIKKIITYNRKKAIFVTSKEKSIAKIMQKINWLGFYFDFESSIWNSFLSATGESLSYNYFEAEDVVFGNLKFINLILENLSLLDMTKQSSNSNVP